MIVNSEIDLEKFVAFMQKAVDSFAVHWRKNMLTDKHYFPKNQTGDWLEHFDYYLGTVDDEDDA